MKKKITLCIAMLILSMFFVPTLSAYDGWIKGGVLDSFYPYDNDSYSNDIIIPRNLSGQYYVNIRVENKISKEVYVYDAGTGEQVFQFPIDIGISIVTENGNLLCGRKGNVYVFYNYLNGEKIHEINSEGEFSDFVISDDNKKLILIEKEQMLIKVLDIDTGLELQSFYLDKNPVNVDMLSLSANGEFLYFVSLGNIEIWSVENEKLMKSIPFNYKIKSNSPFISTADEENLIFIDDDEKIRILNIEAGEIIREFSKDEHEPEDFVISPNGKFLISTEDISRPHFWDVENDTLMPNLPFSRMEEIYISNSGEFLSFLNNVGVYCGRYLESPIEIPHLVLYNLGKEEIVGTFPDGYVGVFTPKIIFSQDGKKLMAMDNDNRKYHYEKIYIWDVENEEVLYEIYNITNILSFTPNGNQLIYGNENKLMFFDLELKQVTDSIITTLSDIISLKFSHSQKLFMCSDSTHTAIYEFGTQKYLSKISAIKLKFKRDENLLLEYNDDFEFFERQTHTGDVVSYISFNLGYSLLDVSDDGEYFLASDDNDFVVFSIDPGKTIYNFELPSIYERTARFMIDHKHVLIWENHPPFFTEVNIAYDLETMEGCVLSDGDLIFSSDRTHYAFANCPGEYGYRSFCDGFVSVEEDGERIISDNKLSVYPNPFDQFTIINYELTIPGNVVLMVYDVLGNEVAVLVNEYQGDGSHSTVFDAASHPEGMYYVVLKGNGEMISAPVVVVR